MSQERPKSPDLSHLSQKESIEHPEIKLSLEQIEQIVEKMQDINAVGTAFTWVSSYDLGRILREGILSMGKNTSNLKEWAKRTRKIREGILKDKGYHSNLDSYHTWETSGVFINIVGREETKSFSSTKIQDGFGERDRSLSLLVDLSNYEEIPPFDFGFEIKPMRTRTYKAANLISYDDYKRVFGDRPTSEYEKITWDELREKIPALFDKNGKVKIKNSSFGFYVSYNIPPKFLQGIVLGHKVSLTDVVKSMISEYERTGRMQSLLPVYNYSGDMLWPQHISYEEIKRQLAEQQKAVIADQENQP